MLSEWPNRSAPCALRIDMLRPLSRGPTATLLSPYESHRSNVAVRTVDGKLLAIPDYAVERVKGPAEGVEERWAEQDGHRPK